MAAGHRKHRPLRLASVGRHPAKVPAVERLRQAARLLVHRGSHASRAVHKTSSRTCDTGSWLTCRSEHRLGKPDGLGTAPHGRLDRLGTQRPRTLGNADPWRCHTRRTPHRRPTVLPLGALVQDQRGHRLRLRPGTPSAPAQSAGLPTLSRPGLPSARAQGNCWPKLRPRLGDSLLHPQPL